MLHGILYVRKAKIEIAYEISRYTHTNDSSRKNPFLKI